MTNSEDCLKSGNIREADFRIDNKEDGECWVYPISPIGKEIAKHYNRGIYRKCFWLLESRLNLFFEDYSTVLNYSLIIDYGPYKKHVGKQFESRIGVKFIQKIL